MLNQSKSMITQLKTKSTVKQQVPKEILDSLSYRLLSIIDICEYFRKKGCCFISQETLARKLGVSRKTINRDIAYLVDVGLLEVQHRFNNSNITSTSHWFRRSEVQNLLPYYFCNFVVITLSLSMLSSQGYTSIEKLRFKNPSFYLSPSSEGVSMGKEAGRTARKETKKEESMGVPEASHIKKVCQALQRRGSTITNDDSLKLLAYQPDVHERASERFKKAQGKIKDPLAYYLFICKDILSQDGRRADWQRVEKLRQEGFVLLDQTLQGATVSYVGTRAEKTNPQKGNEVAPPYSEQVAFERKRMAEEAEARKSKTGPLAEEVLSWQQVVQELQRRVSEGDLGAQWTLPMAIGKLKHLISQYQVEPDSGKAMAVAQRPTPISSPDFKTPASVLLKKSEPVALKDKVWEDWKEHDPMLEEEQ